MFYGYLFAVLTTSHVQQTTGTIIQITVTLYFMYATSTQRRRAWRYPKAEITTILPVALYRGLSGPNHTCLTECVFLNLHMLLSFVATP